MEFPYSSVISRVAESEDLLIFRRPEIEFHLIGVVRKLQLIGLVDTGSDFTILPKSAADFAGIPLQPAEESTARLFSGQAVSLLRGDVQLELRGREHSVLWHTEVFFYDFAVSTDETVILGHAGFLDYFTATFDGLEAMLTLMPNETIPTAALQ